MTGLGDKEKAAENKYAHDKETEFKIRARRDKLLGSWVAGKIGLSGAAADEYAHSYVGQHIEHAHEESVLARIRQDFSKYAVAVSDHDIRAQIHHLLLVAKEQIEGSLKS